MMKVHHINDEARLFEYRDIPSRAGSYEVRVVWPDGTHCTYSVDRPCPLLALAAGLEKVAEDIRRTLSTAGVS